MARDPRRVYVIYTGDPYPGITPYGPMKRDPVIVVTPVQGSLGHYAGISLEDIHRALRVYMPRSYDQFVREYNVTILSDTNSMIFGRYGSWIKRSVLEHGKGVLMVAGLESFGGARGYAGWVGNPVMDVLPVDAPSTGPDWLDGGAPIEVTPNGYKNPFMASLPFKPLPEYMKIGTDGNIVVQKPGSILLTRWVSPQYNNPPCYVTWDIAKGRAFAMMHDWTPAGGTLMSRWEYYGDFAINLMLYLAKKPLPSDSVVAHEYRRLVQELAVRKSTLYSLADFVESLGGSARPITKEMGNFDSAMKKAAELYLDGDYDGALGATRDAENMLSKLEELAIKVKNEALAWVFMIEWLSVSGVSLLSGLLLWNLMVRRKLYREVGTTEGPSYRLDLGDS